MGYERHHAIVVSASRGNWIEHAHEKALAAFAGVAPVTDPTPPAVNGVRSFLIAPDGSKEGWDESLNGDVARAQYVAWLRSTAYEDGSSPLKWVEIQYADERQETKVVADSDERLRLERMKAELERKLAS